MRVAALEDNVAFLEQWCEEQQDALDRTAPRLGRDAADDLDASRRVMLRVVDLRDSADSPGAGDQGGPDPCDTGDDLFAAVVETPGERPIDQLRAHLDRIRASLAARLAPREAAPVDRQVPPAAPAQPAVPPQAGGPPPPGGRRPGARPVSVKPAGRTAP